MVGRFDTPLTPTPGRSDDHSRRVPHLCRGRRPCPAGRPRAGHGLRRGVRGEAAGARRAGGGGSALTATTLVARGGTPRRVIGTVHLAKCVVSVAASVSFLLMLGLSHGAAVAGQIVGGVLAAPVGAILARR